MINIVLQNGDKCEVSFEDAEEVFEISCRSGMINIVQTAGFQVGPDNYEDDKIIYKSEDVFNDF